MGGGGSSGPTLQQQQLESQQAITNASLNNEENLQRKTILNAMQGTRVFRGSALSRSLAGNSPGSAAMNPAPGPAVPGGSSSFLGGRNQKSLFDLAPGSGATSAGGAGPSNPGTSPAGGYAGGIGAGGGGRRGGGPAP